MPPAKELTVQQLAKALSRLSPKEFESLVEILDKENLKSRRAMVRREVAMGKVISEKELFKGLD